MRTSILALAFLLAISVTPAFAQHGHSNGHSNSKGGTHGTVQHNEHPGPQEHGAGPAQHGEENHFDHDRFGHDFHHEDFGRAHWTHFGVNDGRWFGGRHEFFFGGFWFYPYGGIWPGWFYSCNTYFDIAPDGFWYAYCYDRPGLSFRINID